MSSNVASPAIPMDRAAAAALALSEITAGYGKTTILRGVDVAVPKGTIVALLGPNGAGKTTLLSVAAGLVRPNAGTITIAGNDMTRRPAYERSRAGLCLVPEGRGIFPNLTVRENLVLHVPARSKERSFEVALEAFPALRDRLGQSAGSMSGGQQQMLALARCFLAEPAVVLLDEVSMGLAPAIVEEIFKALRRLADTGVALLLVEQYISQALEMADSVYLLNRGTVAFHGRPSELDADELMRRYVGAPLNEADGPRHDTTTQ